MFLLFDLIQFILFAVGVYYVFISSCALVRTAKERQKCELHTFALVVAVHNEERVVGELIESLKKLEYPKEKYKIFIVADNCSDRTAEIARNAGVTVFERFDESKKGKGYALDFAFEKVFAEKENFGYFCVFDADNLIKRDFLIHMNQKINEGYRAVQGYIDSKNPSDNWLTFSYSLWYWINNRLTQLSRHNLDIGCRLGGTGFAVDTELIKEIGWGATCLAEDIEFTLKLALRNVKVGWAHDAVVYDEKPRKMTVSIRQRQRWSQGLADVSWRYILPLAEKVIKEKSTFAFHMIMNFLGDALYLISLGFLTLVYGMMLFVNENTMVYELLCRPWEQPWKLFLLATVVIMNNALVVAALYNDKKLEKCITKKVAGFVLYILSWIPIGIVGVFRKNKKEWFHTPHSGSGK